MVTLDLILRMTDDIYKLTVVGQPSCATLRSKLDKVLSFETKLRRGGFEMGRQGDGFETVSQQKRSLSNRD